MGVATIAARGIPRAFSFPVRVGETPPLAGRLPGLGRFRGEGIGVDGADAGGVVPPDSGLDLGGVRLPVYQVFQGPGVDVVARVQEDEAAGEPPAVAPKLLLRGPDPHPRVAHAGAVQDAAGGGPALADRDDL